MLFVSGLGWRRRLTTAFQADDDRRHDDRRQQQPHGVNRRAPLPRCAVAAPHARRSRPPHAIGSPAVPARFVPPVRPSAPWLTELLSERRDAPPALVRCPQQTRAGDPAPRRAARRERPDEETPGLAPTSPMRP